MSNTLSINLDRPIKAVNVLDCYANGGEPGVIAEQNALAGELKAQKQLLDESCQTLDGLITKVSQFYDEIFAGQKEDIAKLSVEIARRVLMQKVKDGDYEIESIIKEAIKNAPTKQDLVVHLNPDDLLSYQKTQRDSGVEESAGIELVGDANIGRAECVLESPRGIIKSMIEEHLSQIEKALKKSE